MTADATLITELEEQRPRFPVGLLSRREKDRAIERGLVALYRWYVARSQATRNWNPDKSFEWRAFRTEHSPEMNTLLEGFYAIEQYTPDYVMKILGVVKKSHGRRALSDPLGFGGAEAHGGLAEYHPVRTLPLAGVDRGLHGIAARHGMENALGRPVPHALLHADSGTGHPDGLPQRRGDCAA